ncbi:MAG: flagellar filament capping protein FliD [Verrucomicrobiota bacterium]
MSDFQVAGLASGFDWKSLVDQLIEIERVPQRRLEEEKRENDSKSSALGTVETKLGNLGNALSDLQEESLFNAKTTDLSAEDINISASASTSTAVGNYEITVTQLATASKRTGSTDAGGTMGAVTDTLSTLRLATDISGGDFTINGQSISVETTDTLQDVFDAISTATSGVVTAAYDAVGDKVTLTSSSGQLELGADEDTSNFLDALRLKQLEVVDAGSGSVSVTSARELGVVDLSSSIADSGITGSFTGSDTFYINGVQIDFDADNESMQTLMNTVNASDAGVTMSYDSAADQFRIVNNETGAYEMNVTDSSNGLLAAIGLDGSATVGNDLTFSIDGGSSVTSRTNVITSDDHGIEGLTITANETGTQKITISRDSTELKTKIDDFIAKYNDIQDYILEKTKIETNDDEVEAGELADNREITALDSDLRSLAFTAIDGMSGDIFRLEHLGIDFISGTSKLEIKDSDALNEALASNLDVLEEFFMEGDTSFAARMEEFIEDFTDDDGILDIQQENLSERNKRIDAQIEEMERRVEFQRSALEAGFIAMETAQSNIQNQQSALASLQF